MVTSENPIIVVPARLASKRFPQKILADAGGKPLVLRTAERIREQSPEFDLCFAVDDAKVNKVLIANNFQTIMTDPLLPSGTDRVAVANQFLKREFVINVQADEPFIKRDHIMKVAAALKKEHADLSTVATFFRKEEDFLDPNQVKVVMDLNGYALYFSRSPIPFIRDSDHDWETQNSVKFYKHLGIYGYKYSFLEDFLKSKESELEKIEKLEQLRALQKGFRIAVGVSDYESVGIDIPSDLSTFPFI